MRFIAIILLLSAFSATAQPGDILSFRLNQIEHKLRKQQREIDSLKNTIELLEQESVYQLRGSIEQLGGDIDTKRRLDSLIEDLRQPNLKFFGEPLNPGFNIDTATWRKLIEAGGTIDSKTIPEDTLYTINDSSKVFTEMGLSYLGRNHGPIMQVDTFIYDRPDTIQVVRNVSNTAPSNILRHVDHSLYPVVCYMTFDRIPGL